MNASTDSLDTINKQLHKFFQIISSLEKDPDLGDGIFLSEGSSLKLRYCLKRAILFLTQKIVLQNLEPIAITLDQQGNQHQDILRSFEDNRCTVDVAELIESKDAKSKTYLTPLFLEMFDFSNT